MELTVLGAGPAYTDRVGAAGASFLVREDGAAIVLDLGQGAFPNLAARMDPSRLLAVVVSHLHPDHFVDLVPLRHYLRYQAQPPGRVAVYGPAGLADRLDALNGEPAFAAAALDVHALRAGPPGLALAPFRVEARLVPHTAESYAFRVSPTAAPQAPALVYSGDCADAAALLPLVRPGDTLLAEVSFGPGPVPVGAMHLDAPVVGQLAARSGVGRLLLTHLQMGFDPEMTLEVVRAAYDGPLQLVLEGDVIAL